MHIEAVAMPLLRDGATRTLNPNKHKLVHGAQSPQGKLNQSLLREVVTELRCQRTFVQHLSGLGVNMEPLGVRDYARCVQAISLYNNEGGGGLLLDRKYQRKVELRLRIHDYKTQSLARRSRTGRQTGH